MDFSGRVDRRGYIVAQLVFVPLADVGLDALALALWNFSHDFPTDLIPQLLRGTELPRPASWVLLAVAAVALIVGIIGNLSFTVRRLHDLDFSGWFLFVPPIVTLIDAVLSGDTGRIGATSLGSGAAFEIVLMVVPGVAEANIYGASLRPRTGEVV